MNNSLILTLNAGSSTIKFGVYSLDSGAPACIGKALIDLQATPMVLKIRSARSELTRAALGAAVVDDDVRELLDEVLTRLGEHFAFDRLRAVAHRIVHGADRFDGPASVTPDVLRVVEELIPLAPLHQLQAVRMIRAFMQTRPGLAQVACFDTAFHHTIDPLDARFAIPRELHDAGIRRYGFHGLSYKHLSQELVRIAPASAQGRVVAAHLGSGASLCALRNGVSWATSMGFSTLDGVPMSTRCGALDPGVVLHLLRQQDASPVSVENMLYHRSGLLGVSGISGDSRVLGQSSDPAAHEALEHFAFHVARSAASLAAAIDGIDALVFTAGIGEHQPSVRSAICRRLAWLGVRLDDAANAANALQISSTDSAVGVYVIPADEERVMAGEAAGLLARGR